MISGDESMGSFIDLTGKNFGMLTVKERGPNKGKSTTWVCECACEEHKLVIVRASDLKYGKTKSCGCLGNVSRKETAIKNKKKNLYDLSGEYGIGWTNNTNKEFYFDLEDYDKIQDYCWYERIDQTGYHVLRTNMYIDGKRKTIPMHQVLGFKGCDHINRNPLDNRKANFRPANSSENNCNQNLQSNNTSGFIGVIWNEPAKLWEAFLMKNKEVKLQTYYSEKRNAIIARLKAEKEFMGEFAPQRHLFEEYGI
jgi:hypothetical protein